MGLKANSIWFVVVYEGGKVQDTTIRIRTKVIPFKHHNCASLEVSSLLESLMTIKDCSKEQETKNNIDKLIRMIVQCDLS